MYAKALDPVPALPPCPSAWPGERKAKRGGQRWLGSGMRPNGTLMLACARARAREKKRTHVEPSPVGREAGWRWIAPSRIGGWQLAAAPAGAPLLLRN